jgi:hypothetical protein
MTTAAAEYCDLPSFYTYGAETRSKEALCSEADRPEYVTTSCFGPSYTMSGVDVHTDSLCTAPSEDVTVDALVDSIVEAAPLPACNENEYKAIDAAGKIVCRPVTMCDKNEAQVRPPGDTHDRVCVAKTTLKQTAFTCGEDEFRSIDMDGVQRCAPKTVCVAGEFEVRPPGPSQDRVCSVETNMTYSFHQCYKNDGENRVKKGYDSHIRLTTFDECKAIANMHGANYFGMENATVPANGKPSKAECLILGDDKLTRHGRVDLLTSEKCGNEVTTRDKDGRDLGGPKRLVVYRRDRQTLATRETEDIAPAIQAEPAPAIQAGPTPAIQAGPTPAIQAGP